MKAVAEFIIIKVPSIFIDETKYAGLNGLKIVKSIFEDPQKHIRGYGYVHSVPDSIFSTPVASNHLSKPSYIDNPKMSFKTGADIELEVQPGDKIYFHHNCLVPSHNDKHHLLNPHHLMTKKEIINGKEQNVFYFKIAYQNVYAAIRYESANTVSKPFEYDMLDKMVSMGSKKSVYTDFLGQDHVYNKTIIPIGSYCLVEPDFETWEDISIPTPETINGQVLLGLDGKPRMKPKDQWLVTKVMPGEKYLRGYVRHVSKPLKGDLPFLKQGMYVYMQKNADTKVTIEDVDYLRMRQRHIFAINQQKSEIYGREIESTAVSA